MDGVGHVLTARIGGQEETLPLHQIGWIEPCDLA